MRAVVSYVGAALTPRRLGLSGVAVLLVGFGALWLWPPASRCDDRATVNLATSRLGDKSTWTSSDGYTGDTLVFTRTGRDTYAVEHIAWSCTSRSSMTYEARWDGRALLFSAGEEQKRALSRLEVLLVDGDEVILVRPRRVHDVRAVLRGGGSGEERDWQLERLAFRKH
jgi:hypothetical protein